MNIDYNITISYDKGKESITDDEYKDGIRFNTTYNNFENNIIKQIYILKIYMMKN